MARKLTKKLIRVKVGAGAKTEKIEEISPGHFKVRVQEPPEKGKANERVIELVAEYFNVRESSVSIVSGEFYREKTILIELSA